MCSYRLYAIAGITNKKHEPEVELSKSEQPLVLVYSGLDTDRPTLKGNVGEAPLNKVSDDGDQIVLLERNAKGNVFTHTIFASTAPWYLREVLLRPRVDGLRARRDRCLPLAAVGLRIAQLQDSAGRNGQFEQSFANCCVRDIQQSGIGGQRTSPHQISLS